MTSSLICYQKAAVTWPSGAYLGSWNVADQTANLARLAAFEAWRGRTCSVLLDWVAAASDATWYGIEGAAYVANISGLSSTIKNKLLITNIPLPADTSTNLAAGAAGSYDAHWTAFATNLVNAGLGARPLRLFHEMNGNWYRWALGTNHLSGNTNSGNPDGGAADFIGYWQKIHAAMRTAGFAGDFVFSPNNGVGGTNFLADTCYPGDSYVDIIAPDCYDQSYVANSYPYVNGETLSQHNARQDVAWNHQLNGSEALAYWLAFAVSHSKKFGLTEWGCAIRSGDNAGGNDSPRFIRRIHQFLADAVAAHPGIVAYDSYFDFDSETVACTLYPGAELPQAATVYRYRWHS